MPSDWYYFKGDQRVGPVPSPQLKILASDGVLAPTDLVWKEGMQDPQPASRVKGLFSEKPDVSPQKRASVPPPLPAVVKPSPPPLLVAKALPSGSQSAKPDSESSQVAPAAVAPPPRLPCGVSEQDVIGRVPVSYRGGWENRKDIDLGDLCVTKAGLHFVASEPAKDFVIPCEEIANVFAPVAGSFPQVMLDRANAAGQVASASKHLTRIAGIFFDGMGEFAVKAAGAAVSGVAASQATLGEPPKNRLQVVTMKSPTEKGRVAFDVQAGSAQDAGGVAEQFFQTMSKTRQENWSLPKSTNDATPGAGSGGLFVRLAGTVIGPLSEAEVRQLVAQNKLKPDDAVRIEVWVPIATLNLFSRDTTRAPRPNHPPTAAQVGHPANPTTGTSTLARTAIIAGGGLAAGVAAAVLLNSGSASAGDAGVQAGRRKIVVDSDGDGVPDTVGVDTDGDGIIDAIGVDVDQDGRIDAVGVDTDHDGKLDTFGFDRDGDGQVDVIGHDFDGDGVLDDL